MHQYFKLLIMPIQQQDLPESNQGRWFERIVRADQLGMHLDQLHLTHCFVLFGEFS